MSPAFLALLMNLVTDAPHLLGQFINLYGDVAHGPGGGAKITKTIGDVAGILAGVVAPSATAAAPAVATAAAPSATAASTGAA